MIIKKYTWVEACKWRKMLCLALLFPVGRLVAQDPVTAVPYEATFEDTADTLAWHLASVPPSPFPGVVTPQTHWAMGNQDAKYGTSSLYVVTGDNRIGYGAGTYAIAAYRTFLLPVGQYDVSFDWKAGGTASEALFVAWVPASQTIAGTASATVPSYMLSNLLPACPVPTETESGGWKMQTAFQHVASTLTVEQANAAVGYHLVFMWRVNSTAEPTPLSVCVDNVMITRKATLTDCFAVPVGLANKNLPGMTEFSWQGNADAYDIEVYSSNSKTPFYTQYGLAAQSLQLPLENMPEGVYSFRVRAVCSDDVSQWAEYTDILVYDPSSHCLDYLNFTGDGVLCEYGTWGFGTPSRMTGVVNHGSDSEASRHTYHYKEGETDPRTGNMLRTKPDGAVAAVRLGNWNTDAEWESVTYTLPVTPDIGVLQLRYAVVLQDPQHPADEQPRFTLEVLDANGGLINATCAAVDFKAGNNTEGWHQVGEGYDLVLWKDWTLFGLNVQDYVGQTVKIRLATYDCSQTGHYGYAYFTLDCSSGDIIGATCGEKPRTLTVPDGFKYRWYKPNNMNEPFYAGQDPASSELYIAPSDSNFYACDLISLANNNCWFTLTSSAMARFPKALAKLKHSPKDCRNLVDISNRSGIYGFFTEEQTGITDSVRLSDCETYTWALLKEDGTEDVFSTQKNPDPVEMPLEGGTMQLKLTVTMAGDVCADTRVFALDVPAIGPTEAETTEYICEGGSVEFEGETYTEPGTHQVILKNMAGCDSILTLHLVQLSPQYILSDTMVCNDAPYQWEGQSITETGTYYHTVPYRTFNTECDSLIQERSVTVLESLEATLEHVPAEICGHDRTLPLSFHVDAGVAKYWSLLFDEAGHAGGFVDLLEQEIADPSADITIEVPIAGETYRRPNTYKADMVLYNYNMCGNVDFPIEFNVLYPDTILMQLWDDIISVTNTRFNGGYEFSAYQWCKEGQFLPGETAFRLYLPEEKLDTLADYTVLLTRADDGVTMSTCPFRPHWISEREKTELVVSIENVSYSDAPVQVETSRQASVAVYNSLGVLCSSCVINGMGMVQMPSAKGVYVLTAVDAEGTRETYRVIVR